MITYLLQFIAPDDCIQCGSEGLLLCEWCRLSLETVPSRCFYCQKVTNDYDICDKCKNKSSIRKLYVANEYKNEPKELVAALKFKSKRQASIPISRIMAEQLPYLDKETVLVNLPTAPKRVRQRGFDHTKLIAKAIAKQKGVKYINALSKTDNKRQVGATRKQRLNQTVNSYRVTVPRKVAGKNVIIIDDVVTTGASIDSAVKILKKAGVKQVYAAVFAYTK
ncbi:ComF family protein [Candidatus Saccharibacteria bacterium]|nr:ComF family protein [Candidatus Saccharibacteria bacterium]